MCTYPTNKEASWMTKARNTSSLVLMRTLKATSFTILILGIQSLTEMSYSMNKENGIRGQHNEEYNFLPTSEKMIWSIQR